MQEKYPLREKSNQRISSNTGRRWKLAAATVMALAVVLAPAARDPGFDGVVNTAPGEHQHIKLPDGSVAHVGTSSQLKIVFSGKQRLAHLYYGEAVFEVAKDPTRPFTVTTPLIDVTAVGTRFGVSVNRGVIATVSEGAVRITAHDDPDSVAATPLRAGQQLRVSDNAHTQREFALVDATRALQWADGYLEFNTGQTIGEIAREFNRHNVAQIEIEQPDIAARPIQGSYSFRVDASAAFARLIAAHYRLELIEDRTGEVTRLRLVERQRQ
jgi:ferric-dicitrate binding protein FerR (iron transport regulator)